MSILVQGRGNVAIAATTKTFEEMGFDESNIHLIFEVEEALRSWKPGRTINAINGITAGRGYWVIPKTNLESEDLVTSVQTVVLEGDGEFIIYP